MSSLISILPRKIHTSTSNSLQFFYYLLHLAQQFHYDFLKIKGFTCIPVLFRLRLMAVSWGGGGRRFILPCQDEYLKTRWKFSHSEHLVTVWPRGTACFSHSQNKFTTHGVLANQRTEFTEWRHALTADIRRPDASHGTLRKGIFLTKHCVSWFGNSL